MKQNAGICAAVAVLVVLAAAVTAGCVGSSGPAPLSGTVSHGDITEVADYLYEVSYDDYDETNMMENAQYMANLFVTSKYLAELLEDDAFWEEFFENAMIPPSACSSVHNGDYFGRNFDYTYSDASSIVVHVPASDKRYASVGVAGSVILWTPEYIEALMTDEDFALLPFATLDGINEKGVGINSNVAPVYDLEKPTTGTNPGKMNLPMEFVPRYVLDHAASAKEAVDLLSACSLVAMNGCPEGLELHWLICDSTESYIVECINNEMKAVNGDVMTNYYLTTDSPTPHSMGIERYNILTENIAEAVSVDGMDSLMQRAQYTKMYDPKTTPRRYSELYLEIPEMEIDITIDSPDESKQAILDYVSEMYLSAERKPNNSIWQTLHSSIYDLKNLTLRLHVQENYEKSFEYHL